MSISSTCAVPPLALFVRLKVLPTRIAPSRVRFCLITGSQSLSLVTSSLSGRMMTLASLQCSSTLSTRVTAVFPLRITEPPPTTSCAMYVYFCFFVFFVFSLIISIFPPPIFLPPSRVFPLPETLPHTPFSPSSLSFPPFINHRKRRSVTCTWVLSLTRATTISSSILPLPV